MITEFKELDIDVPDFGPYTKCLDKLISVGHWAYDPKEEKMYVPEQSKNVGLYLVETTVFPKYFVLEDASYPMYPTLNRGIANNISKFVYDSIKTLYKSSTEYVGIEYNTVNFNIAKGNVFRHSHFFASPDGIPLNTQVFAYKLTHKQTYNSKFILYNNPIEEYSLTDKCTFQFNGLIGHEVANSDDDYYGYIVYEKW